jgi:hypothetical protein
MMNSIAVVAGIAHRYIAGMAGNRGNGRGGVTMGFMEGAVAPARRMLGLPAQTHEQRLKDAVSRANRREDVVSLKGMSDREILDRIVG